MFKTKKLIIGLEKKYVVRTILAPLLTIGEVAMEVVIPFISAKLIDVGIANKDMAYIVRYGVLLIGLALVALLCGILSIRCATSASQGYAYNLRNRLFSKVQVFSFSNIDKFSTASLITRLTTDVNMSMNVYRMSIQMCIRAPVMMIAGTVMSFSINSRLALIFCFAIPLIILALIIIPSIAIPRFEYMLRCFDNLNADTQENIRAIREVKANVREEFESKKFRKIADKTRKSQVWSEGLVVSLIPVIVIVMCISMVAVLWFGGKQVIEGTLLSGELISFFAYVIQVLISLTMLGMVFVSLVMAKASNRRILEVLNEESDIKDKYISSNVVADENKRNKNKTGAKNVAGENEIARYIVEDGSIIFQNVYFSYQKHSRNYILSDINLSIKSGETIGIMGVTGSAKSTLVSLIPRLYDVSSGEVIVGGHNVKDYSLYDLREAVAMVLQKNILFSGTIKENLLWGNESATDEQIVNACKAADADDFIRGFTEGYDTVLGQSGVNVSGGQKQRICIARALLKNPKILILDDSTSAVDTATEERIQSALREMAPDTTKIIIAQRISSVKNADKIIVLDDGRINGIGTHEELLENNKIYKDVFDSQLQGSGDADIDNYEAE